MSNRCRRWVLTAAGAGVSAMLAGCTGPGGTNDDEGSDSDFSSNDADSQVSQDTPTARPDSDGDGVIDRNDEFPQDPNLSQVLFEESDRRNVQEDEWRYYMLSFPQSGRLYYSYTVREGPEIDVIVMDESEYQYFQDGDRYNRYTNLSTFGDAGNTVNEPISAGDYRLIFDNTEREEAYPPSNFSNDIAEVEFEIGAYI